MGVSTSLSFGYGGLYVPLILASASVPCHSINIVDITKDLSDHAPRHCFQSFFVSGCRFKIITTPSRILSKEFSPERTDLFSTSDSQWPHPQERTPGHLYPISNPNPLGCRTCNHQFEGPHLAWRYDSAEVWSPTHPPNDLILRTA